MTSIDLRSTNEWRALPVFLALAFLLSWYPWALHAAGYPGNGNPNPLGLLLAALIASSIDSGWRGPVAILRSIVRLRAAPSLWLASIGIPIAAVAAGLALAANQNIPVELHALDWSDLLDRFLIAFLFVALGEEPAWRGFLQPLLQRRLSPLTAALSIGAIWAFWHLPLMGTEFAWPLVPAFLVSVFAAAIALAWLYNASNSSLLPMIMHATVNTVGAGYAFKFVPAANLEQFWWLYAGVWAFIAFAIATLTLGRLGARRSIERHAARQHQLEEQQQRDQRGDRHQRDAAA